MNKRQRPLKLYLWDESLSSEESTKVCAVMHSLVFGGYSLWVLVFLVGLLDMAGLGRFVGYCRFGGRCGRSKSGKEDK